MHRRLVVIFGTRLLVALMVISPSEVFGAELFFTREKTDKTKVSKKCLFSFENNTALNILPGQKFLKPGLRQLMKKLNKLLVEDYNKWHNRTLEKLNKGEFDARSLRLLVHWSERGIGDRFRGMVSAYLMAVMTNRLFLIKWEEPLPLTNIFKLGVHSNFAYDSKRCGGENYSIPRKDFVEPYKAVSRFINGTNIVMMGNWDLNSLFLFFVIFQDTILNYR